MSKASAFKAVAHGLSRAAIARLRYVGMKGAFLRGFVSSGAGAGYKGAFAMAIVGGTVSEIGGGKFANGAWGSAFQYLFNEMMTREQFIKENGWSQDPNAKALENSLGANAENWYGKDAKMAYLIFGYIKYGASFGFVLYNAAASIYGIGSYAAQEAGGAGFITGSTLGFEGQLGLGESNPKRYLKTEFKGSFK